jgi:hypothetical protein
LLIATPGLWAQTSTVRLRVTDPLGTVVPSASASLLDANGRPVNTLTANDAGEIIWTGLPLGDSHFRVSASGFSLFPLNVTIRSALEQRIEVALEVGCIECPPADVTTYMPYSNTLDPAPEPSPSSQEPKPAKRHWWRIFR